MMQRSVHWQIKIYNSMNPAWVPYAMTRRRTFGHARRRTRACVFHGRPDDRGGAVAGITHINQFILGWVIGPGEDTRTLFRFTAMKRL